MWGKGMNKESKHGVAMNKFLTGKKSSRSILIGFPIWCLLSIIALVPMVAFGQMTKGQKYKKTLSIDINYDREKESVGMLSIKGLQRRGPESFSVDIEGNIYIADTVNQRIQIFSSHGNHQYGIVLKEGTVASDIALDKKKYIYIYDDVQGKLHQYDKKGDFIATIDVDLTRWKTRGQLHIIDNEIYIRSSDQEDILIGRIVEDTLETPPIENLDKPIQKGIHGFSGRRYLVKLTRLEKGTIEIEKNGATSNLIDIPIKGIVSIKFLQEDKKGNFYIQTERIDGEKIILELQKFASSGIHLTTVLIPENDYSSWTVKLLSLDENGSIYQFLPAKGKGRLSIFREE